MAAVRSIAMWIGVVIFTIFLFTFMIPACVIAYPFDPLRKTAHFFSTLWARRILWVNPGVRVSVEGLDHLAGIGGIGSAVLAANHQSMADIVALYYLGHPFKWISKREILYVPIIGIAMWLSGYIFLKRGDKESIRQCMEASRVWLLRGVSIMMFPEGTRSHDGRLKAFKDGAFKMSVESGRPVVPVVLKGTRDLVQKGSWKFATRTDMRVRVGPPIAPREGADAAAEIDRLRRETRAWILRNMAEMDGVAESALDAARDPGNKGPALRVPSP